MKGVNLVHHAALTMLCVGFLSGCDREPDAWAQAQAENTIAGYQAFLEKHPDGNHADEASRMLQPLLTGAAWDEAVSRNSKQSYEDFAKSYPDSANSPAARIRIKALTFGPIDVATSLQTPPNVFMMSSPSGQIQAYPQGTTLTITLSAEADSHPVSTTIATEYSEMKDGNAYFNAANGDCYFLGRTDYSHGVIVKLCDSAEPSLPEKDSPEDILLYTWKWRQQLQAPD